MQSKEFENLQPLNNVQNLADNPAHQELVTSLYGDLNRLGNKNGSTNLVPEMQIIGADNTNSSGLSKLAKNGTGADSADPRKPEDRDQESLSRKPVENSKPEDRSPVSPNSETQHGDKLKPENKESGSSQMKERPGHKLQPEHSQQERQSGNLPGDKPKTEDLDQRRGSTPMPKEQRNPEESDQNRKSGDQPISSRQSQPK